MRPAPPAGVGSHGTSSPTSKAVVGGGGGGVCVCGGAGGHWEVYSMRFEKCLAHPVYKNNSYHLPI